MAWSVVALGTMCLCFMGISQDLSQDFYQYLFTQDLYQYLSQDLYQDLFQDLYQDLSPGLLSVPLPGLFPEFCRVNFETAASGCCAQGSSGSTP